MGQYCISKNVNINLSFINKTTTKYKINLINFTEVHDKNFLNIVLYHNYHIFRVNLEKNFLHVQVIKIEYKNTVLICELNYILHQILNNKLSRVHNYIQNAK